MVRYHTPFISRPDQSSNQAHHNHDLVESDDPKDSWPGKSGGQAEVEKKERRGNEPDKSAAVPPRLIPYSPIDVADVEDLTVDAI